MPIGSQIVLDDFEQAVCRRLSALRHANNRHDGVSNSKIGPQSDEDTDVEGIAAEFAFAKFFNCYPDLTIGTRSSSNKTDTGDITLPNGMSVDVKSTTYANGKLVVAPWKQPTGHFFALMVGEFPSYTYKGVFLQTEAIVPERLGTLGHGDTYIVDQSELIELGEGIRRIQNG